MSTTSKGRRGRRKSADPDKARIGRDGIERKPITIRIPLWMKKAAFDFAAKTGKEITFTDLVCTGLGAGPVSRDDMRDLRSIMQEAVPEHVRAAFNPPGSLAARQATAAEKGQA